MVHPAPITILAIHPERLGSHFALELFREYTKRIVHFFTYALIMRIQDSIGYLWTNSNLVHEYKLFGLYHLDGWSGENQLTLSKPIPTSE